jgi:hypothetical protein
MRCITLLLIVVITGLALEAVPGMCCISDPSVTVIYDIQVDMDFLKSLKKEGFSFEIVNNVIPNFGAQDKEREFVMYKAHYGWATVMVASDALVFKAHEEKYNWEKGVETELLFLETIGALTIVHTDIPAIARVASWESSYGKNVYKIPEEVEVVSFSGEEYPVSPAVTDYFCMDYHWIAVPGNGTVTHQGNVLTTALLRCGGEITADTSKLSVFAPFREVLLVCNSIDYELTGKELKNILIDEGYIVRRVTPDTFDVYRWFSPKIILLGGHKSPEGMGDIVGTILSVSEQQMVEKKGMAMFAHDDVDFRNQSIVVLAGKDREETQEITLLRVDDIIMWLEYQP